ncbi:MAG: hypothetical protein PHE16_09900 [Aliarcobacter sp.]|nr:hypothetical protein [Aliarcobacter sp.]
MVHSRAQKHEYGDSLRPMGIDTSFYIFTGEKASSKKRFLQTQSLRNDFIFNAN